MMWIALGVAASAVVGMIFWSFRRRPSGAEEAAGGFPGWDWEAQLTEDSRVAFIEGVRTAGYQTGVGEEQGVLRIFDPLRLISLHLLADRFAASGSEGLYDPEATVRALVAQCVAVEQPGVLHLRDSWLRDEVDGMNRRAFGAAVREIVSPDGASYLDETGGSLEVTVPGEYANTLMLDLARVLDRFRAQRDERPGMPTGAVLRDVVFRLIADDAPGLTWTRPPAGGHRAAVLAASRPAKERDPAS